MPMRVRTEKDIAEFSPKAQAQIRAELAQHAPLVEPIVIRQPCVNVPSGSVTGVQRRRRIKAALGHTSMRSSSQAPTVPAQSNPAVDPVPTHHKWTAVIVAMLTLALQAFCSAFALMALRHVSRRRRRY